MVINLILLSDLVVFLICVNLTNLVTLILISTKHELYLQVSSIALEWITFV